MTTPAAQRQSDQARIKSNLFPSVDESHDDGDDDNQTAGQHSKIPIIDSHIHLYPASETHTLAWYSSKTTPPALMGQRSVVDYIADTNHNRQLEGFIFLETDRVCDVAEDNGEHSSGWEGPLMEVDWVRRIVTGEPRDGEGHEDVHSKLCLGIVPWAPVSAGSLVLQRYLERVKEVAGESYTKICGFRFLVQDKPDGTMLEDKFIDGLKYMGKHGFIFDLGIDMHRRGNVQLDEAITMIERAHQGVDENEKVRIVINHLCKPDLSIKDTTTSPEFLAWRSAIYTLSTFPRTYMKVSGAFSELPSALQNASKQAVFDAITPWLIVVLTAFRGRLMFGSDWPVCTAGTSEAWVKWRWIVERMCRLSDMTLEEEIMLWSGTAIEAYGLTHLE